MCTLVSKKAIIEIFGTELTCRCFQRLASDHLLDFLVEQRVEQLRLRRDTSCAHDLLQAGLGYSNCNRTFASGLV